MPRYSRDEATLAVRQSLSYSETLRRLGLRAAGGNHRLLRHWVDDVWRIPTDHFDPAAARIKALRREPVPLEEVMVENSSYSRGALKRRLFESGLKERVCEKCGQDETWRGERIALILDHVNGVPNDHRLENLQVVCPNCAAALATHCGRKNAWDKGFRYCLHCGGRFQPRTPKHRYCSRSCGTRWSRAGIPRPSLRRVVRPPYGQLLAEVAASNYSAVGRKYGVSDNAIRKWVRAYEREAAGSEGDPG